jgi:hypothetical protein
VRVRPGTTTRLKLDGYNLLCKEVDLTLPEHEPEGVRSCCLALGKGERSNPVPLVVSSLPEVRETEADNDSPPKAQLIPVPCGVSGCMDADNDVDCFAFDAKKGQGFTFDVIAQRAGSRLDSVLRILGPKGQQLAENDDHLERSSGYNGFNRTADSRIEGWIAPADGRYVVQVRDVHQRGGPAFGYFLQV